MSITIADVIDVLNKFGILGTIQLYIFVLALAAIVFVWLKGH